jgi:hypothetical protein
MSDTESEVEAPKKVDKRKGRTPTEAQMAGLRKGVEIMKQKREALAKEREAHEAKKKKGEIPLDAPAPKLIPKPKVVERKTANREVIEKPRKPRTPAVTATDLEAMKTSILTALAPKKEEEKVVEKVKEVPVEKIVERVVQKDKVVSGSALLDAIFFK